MTYALDPARRERERVSLFPYDIGPTQPDAGLKEPDAKVARRLENIRDLVLYRFNGTGVQSAIERAIERVGLIPVFPVANLNNFSNGKYVFASANQSSVADAAV